MNDKVLQELFLQTVDNQLESNKPPQTRETFERLKKEGYSEQDAKLVIAQCVAFEMVKVATSQTPFNEARFVKCLEKLPNPPVD